MNTFNLTKYTEALNNLLGVDHAYLSGDENVDAIVELIVMAKELTKENKTLRAQTQDCEKRKYIKLNATIEMPYDMAELDVMNFLTDALEEHGCEWCAGMTCDKDKYVEAKDD